MGRVTNFSKEYLLFKSMVYAEENRDIDDNARSLASFVVALLIQSMRIFKSIRILKRKILEEITICFDRYLTGYVVDDFLVLFHLLKRILFRSMKVSRVW